MTVDLVILTVRDNQLQLLLVERGREPFQGRLALPGGFVLANEDLFEAAHRELREETGVDGQRLHLEQLGSYGTPGRDPRGRIITVAYLAIAPDLPVPVAGTDAAGARWEPLDRITDRPGSLAFDHEAIVANGVERARSMLEYTTIATVFCGENFTISDLRRVYEVVWSRPVDPRNFNRKVKRTRGFIEPVGQWRMGAGRPAALYRKGAGSVLFPPMLRVNVGDEDE